LINKDEGITKPTNQETITKSNIYMHSIKIVVSGTVKDQSAFGFGNSGKRAKGRRKLPTIDPFTITTNLQDVLVVPKLSTTHNAMNLFSRPMSLGVQSIRHITRPNQWKRRTWVMEELGDLVKGQAESRMGDGGGVAIGCKDCWRVSAKKHSWAVIDSISKDRGSEGRGLSFGDAPGKGGRTHLGM
jgi:hypothetical protein